MDIESEHLGIPETEYKCNVRLPSAEFQVPPPPPSLSAHQPSMC